MDCKPNEIACRLNDIADALAEPSSLEVATFCVSALAAVGTIALAFMNWRILRKQHDLELKRELASENERRLTFAARLREYALLSGPRIILKGQIPLDEWTRSLTDMSDLAIRTGDNTAGELVRSIFRRIESANGTESQKEVVALVTELANEVTAWAQKPPSRTAVQSGPRWRFWKRE